MIIKKILDYFRGRQHRVTVRQTASQDPPPSFDNPPAGFMPIESYYDLHRIPGTTLDVGAMAKVLKTPGNEIITVNQRQGIQAGCGHHICTIDTVITELCIQYGIGGVCQDCAQQAARLQDRGAITAEQAQALSLYCSACASHCDGCHRSNICLRHSQKFENLDGTTSLLCPDCLPKAEGEKFFKKTLAVVLLPFVDYRRLPPTSKKR